MSEGQPKQGGLNFETVGSIVAMIIGGTALFVAWDQAQVMRAQQHASVWPILDAELYVSLDADTRFIEFVLVNAGVGPALVESVSIMIDGKSIARWSEVTNALFKSPPGGPMQFNGEDVEGSVIAPGDKVSVGKAIWAKSEDVDAAFKALSARYVQGDAPNIYVEACYCSVFERCWKTMESGRSAPVKKCPAPTNFFSSLFTEEIK